MIRRRNRTLAAGALFALIWTLFVGGLAVLQHDRRTDFTGSIVAVDVGIGPWLTLSPRRTIANTRGIAFPRWVVHPAGTAVLVVASVVSAMACFRLARWVIRNSAIHGVCERCGHSSAGLARSTCPECGSGPLPSRHSISPRSAQLLWCSLGLVGFGTLGLLLEGAAQAFGIYMSAARAQHPPPQPDWVGVQGWLSVLLFCAGACLFMIWLFREPRKHAR